MNLAARNGTIYSSSFSAQSGETLVKRPPRQNTFMEELVELFKQHARIDWADDDRLCQLYLNSAISRIEQWCEMPIYPASYDWDPSSAMSAQHQFVEILFRNSIIEGNWVDFDQYRARKIVPVPSEWPLRIEVGFTSVEDCPDDLLLSIFEMALGLYELRSNAEMAGVYAHDIMVGNLSRYWVSRV